VAFSPDGSLLASGGDDQNIRLWDPKTGRTVRTLKGHAGSVSSVTFRPDGVILVSANADGTIGLWDPTSGNELKSLSGHDGRVWAVAYNNDGTLLASAGRDTTVRIWKPVVITADKACEIAAPHLPRQVLEDQIGTPKACTNLR
jgi:WD40 repeat protein